MSEAIEPDALTDAGAQIASLRAANAQHLDPVRWRYIETLAERAAAQPERIKRVLAKRLDAALTAYRQRFEHAKSEAAQVLADGADPQAADAMRRLIAAGSFRQLRRLVASGANDASLSALVRRLEQHALENADARAQQGSTAHPELRTVRHFRDDWSKLSTGRQVAKAIGQAPKDAGPINSHMLVLRSLALMRDISPDYLNRFISYADTLLALAEDGNDKPPAPKKAATPKPAKSAKK